MHFEKIIEKRKAPLITYIVYIGSSNKPKNQETVKNRI
jgi:hypothetical protein